MGLSFNIVEELACHDASCRPPTSGGTGGSISQSSYRMAHRPTSDGPRGYDLLETDYAPSDIYQHPEWYTGFRELLPETMRQLKSARGNPDSEVTIYRAAPKNSADPFSDGDWITLSKGYAQGHVLGVSGGKVFTKRVKARDIRWAADDLMEWGFFPESATVVASATGEYPLARIERNALVALRSLAQRHLSSMGVTAAGIDPLSFVTEGMEVEYLTLAMSLWEQVEDALSGFGLDTLPLEDFYAIVKDSVEASRNQYIDTIKSLIGKQSSGTPTYGEFFFVPDYVPGTGLKPPAPYEVQFGDIRSVLGTLGGGGPSEVPLSTGITGGRILQDVLRENGLATNDKLWLYGETARRTFNGHLQVDGLVFSDWRDEALEIAPQDRWLRTDRYRPGDHWGCACVVVPYIPNFGNPFPLTVVADGSTEEFYNPTQPRDKEGQWTTSGEEKLLDRGVGTGVQVNGSSAWHEVRVTPTEIIQGFNSFKGPLDSTAQVSKIVVMSGRVAVEGKIYAMGKEIGTFERTYERRGMTTRTPFTVINHDSLALSTTSAGIGGAFLRHSVEEYRRQGVKSIVMEAVSGLGANGAYTWAKLGFKLSKGNRTFLSQASRALGKSVKSMDEILSSTDGVAWLKGETGENVRWYGEMLL